MKRKRIGTRDYYLCKQVTNKIPPCTGCCFFPQKESSSRCPQNTSTVLMCVDDMATDYIFVPATNRGIADYVAHKLEYS
jgi:hypothetical protein